MTTCNSEILSGSLFKSLCKYSVQDYSDARNHRYCFKVGEGGDPTKFFVKTEYLNHFLHNNRIDYPFDLLTHNSDININDGDYRAAKTVAPNLRNWYCQNLNGYHPFLHPLPIGLANPKWKHGNVDSIKKAQASIKKTDLLYVNFDIYTNPQERKYCLEQINIEMSDRVSFEEHLGRLSSCFFCISPNGNGLDCHRHWEAFYLKTIPIVTKSPLTEVLRDKYKLPFLIIDDWKDFSGLKLDESLYNSLMSEFSFSLLHHARFLSSDPPNLDE